MTDFSTKSDTELHKELREKREAVREFKFSVAGSQKRNPHEIKKAQKDIARILTELNKRQNAS